jgi:tetratricopeptide (TPR) repeat protein
MKKDYLHIIVTLYLVLSSSILSAQESIFKGLKSDLKKANSFYNANAYHDAVQLYTLLADQKKGDNHLHLKIANCYFMLNKMKMAALSYSTYVQSGGKFNQTEILQYANTLQATGNYEGAISWYQKYLRKNPKDHEISLRIWQLQNIQYLYDDSIFYAVKRLPNNTQSDEICPAIFKNSIVFASNRETAKALNRIDANNKPFFSWYISNITPTIVENEKVRDYATSEPFGTNIQSKYHKGSVCFTSSGDTMVFAQTSHLSSKAKSKKNTTQIFFARKEGKYWKEFEAFSYNNKGYSVNHPALSEDGRTLYFSSDMPGGAGGMDLYKTDLVNGKWSNLQSMGDNINTTQDEKYPFIWNQTLYFSSNGQPGFGGLDNYMVDLKENLLKVINLGYPLNSNFDDFGLVLDKSGTFGYLVSNRNQKVVNDDIFEVYITRPTYPLTISGKIKYKITNIKDSTSELNQLDFAKLELIDKTKKKKVLETQSNAEGSFSLEIPYEGQFILGVSKKDFGVAVVSMNIPRNPKDYLSHDIVIVKELFNISPGKESYFSANPIEISRQYNQ